MSVQRVMGTETEYAVSAPATQPYEPVRLSFAVVGAAADPRTAHVRWDYGREDPVNDARTGRFPRTQARSDMLTDEFIGGLDSASARALVDGSQRDIANAPAFNGARIYVDHAHPEYSAPETLGPFAAVRYDRAGDALMLAAARRASRQRDQDIVLHRNNVDGKGASWGSHENYLMLRNVPFEQVAQLMTAHFVSRQIYTGSGRVGLGERSETAGYQLSQRADYIHAAVGLQTTFDRPIINTRDEPHAGRRYRRLHVIVGDANRMDVPEALRLGTTSLLLWALEQADDRGMDPSALLAKIRLADPVTALHTVSHDLSLSAMLALADGQTTTAWQLQTILLSFVYEAGARAYDTDSRGEPLWPDVETTRIIAMWKQALADTAALRHSDERQRMAMADEASRLEWLLKWQLLERLRLRLSCSWSDPRIAALDLRLAALDPAISPWGKLSSRVVRFDGPAQLQHAETNPPDDTRAWLRGQLLRRYGEQVMSLSWSRITVRDPGSPGGALSVDMSDPYRYTAALCADGFADEVGGSGGAADGFGAERGRKTAASVLVNIMHSR
ncbi:depupylase/deamidase Dop [Bifidobacterium sp.]|jgi:proteasome accessory factor A|uniref:depupylase/deamidase Dop n=1 Tax=Bifidobacterium sp. TaxID=41200 RepID=UPI0025C3BC3E|nr:depupylase/deamidase Dop [Bifidobacterium sp.]MCH4208680.1 proteasome accessory factor PafA2 [Bifidobacterium sp.]MCI1224348.1 proteasome accessory factor PafA2 [Bifidobacterium sp.]